MPLVKFSTNTSLSEGARHAAALELSKLASEVLEKSEDYVQVLVSGDQTMTFGAKTDPTAYLEVYSLGMTEEHAGKLSRMLSEFLTERFSIASDRVFIRMLDHPRPFWGWNGGTF
ncbi:MAG: phenylpyruvate tautomerase MIF-related protein [Verrucomicrobiota bacterium]